ncbi:hypothetical protein [Larkinella soli]|uniref:hypothetical protein n=1 Tax=Larkinella soli TaxID=1770527 RepID=UPI000FFC663C|nr:hypothetical protein [Larkinella soli]
MKALIKSIAVILTALPLFWIGGFFLLPRIDPYYEDLTLKKDYRIYFVTAESFAKEFILKETFSILNTKFLAKENKRIKEVYFSRWQSLEDGYPHSDIFAIFYLCPGKAKTLICNQCCFNSSQYDKLFNPSEKIFLRKNYLLLKSNYSNSIGFNEYQNLSFFTYLFSYQKQHEEFIFEFYFQKRKKSIIIHYYQFGLGFTSDIIDKP